MAKTTSIVDYLKSQGQDSSYSARKKLASSMGISNYSGTASQNTQLLNALQSGKSTSNNSNTKSTSASKTSTTSTKSSTSSTKSNLKGVDDATSKKMNTSYEQSKNVTDATKKSETALSNLETLTSKENIISNSTMNAINSQFVVPSAVTEADAYLAEQLEKIQSGRTSYSDDVRAMLDKIMNREKFSYDVDTDPLFQQALASAMNSGKQAMQDTIGQASALTGGYGSTYATTAGNQAYNAFIEDAYDNLPQYYQMALEAYQAEGDEMYRQYSMLSAEDDKEYNRNVTAYDATYQHRNQLYNEAYTQYRDSVSDAFAMANLELSEHGQKVSDAYNYYNATSDYADTLYNREYQKWSDEVNLAYKYAEMLNSDWWNQTNFDESVRQYEKSFAEEQRQFNENLAEQKRQHNEQMSYNYAALNKKSSSGSISDDSGGIVYDYTAEDMEKASKSKAVSSFKGSILSESEFKRRGNSNNGERYDTYEEYVDAMLDAWNSDKKLTESETAYLVGYYFR